MKRASNAAFVLLVFAIAISLLSCGGGGDGGTPEVVRYVVTDLQGTWYLSTVIMNTRAAGDSYYGQMDVSSGGNIIDGQFNFYPAQTLDFAGGSLALNQDTGVLSGRINTASGAFIIDSGKMDPSKFAMAFNSHDSLSGTQFELTVAVKGGGSYVNADIFGTWHLFGMCSNPAGVGAIRGNMVVDNSGGVSGKYFLDGNEHTINNGTISVVSGSPVILGNFLTDDLTVRVIEKGALDNSKTFASFVANSLSPGSVEVESEIVVMIKEAGSFSNADLAGTWYIAGAAAGHIDPADNGSITGNLTMNSAGTITGGTLNLPDASAPITGGSMTVSAAGALGGTITGGSRSIVFTSGRLDASKKKMAFTDVDTAPAPDAEKRLFILLK